ncbi:MAG: hypothetical protein COA42_06045 [Alteromonadaceae bacterium]|nr:MAG: hypothetical protein COA42_06045 [Alteromonadaceae bacterium]
MNHLKVVVLLLLLWPYANAFADNAEIYSHKHRGAIKGYDIVAFYSLAEGANAVKGSKAITHEWKGATWRFSNEENRQKFAADPEKYAPEYGGYCAFAVSHGFTTSPRPNNWKIVDGKLYLNNNKTSFKSWLLDFENKIAKADNNWPEVLID